MSVTITMPKVAYDKLLAEQEHLLEENLKLSSNKCVRLVTTHRTPTITNDFIIAPVYTTVKDGIYTATELDTIVDERLDSAFQELGIMEIENDKLKERICILQNKLSAEHNKIKNKGLGLLGFN